MFLLEEPVKVASELDAVAVPAPEAETDAGTDGADVAGGGEAADEELEAAELLAVEVGVAALVAGALDVGAEDVGAVEEAGEDAAVDEEVSETDPAGANRRSRRDDAAFDIRGNDQLGVLSGGYVGDKSVAS